MAAIMFHAIRNKQIAHCQGRLVPDWIEQKELLSREGISFTPKGYVDMKRFAWRFWD